MKRSILILSILSTAALIGCQEEGGDCSGDQDNCLILCAELDVDACAAEADCAVIQGKPLEEVGETDFCLDFEADFEDLGCMQADSGCTDAEVFAVDPDGIGYYFSNGCIPESFEGLQGAVAECEGA